LVSSVGRDVVRAGLVAVGGVFSGTGGCLGFFASGLAPTGGCGSVQGFVLAGLAPSRASPLPQRVAVSWQALFGSSGF
jgi:hypothetical protein